MSTKIRYDRHWAQKVVKILKEKNISHQLVTYRADSKLLKMREYDWEESVVPGMWMNVKLKQSRHELRLTGLDADGVDAPIGTVEFFDESKDWKYAITLPLYTKTLEYRSGDDKECLKYDQQAILLEDNMITELEGLGIRSRPPVKVTPYSESCIIILVVIVIAAFFVIGC